MTREEQLAIEAKRYYPDDINCYDAFLHGVKWERKHQANVWHDASEEPRYEELLLGEDSDGFSIYRWCGQEDNWEAFVNVTGLSRWAYVSDLLPKGGKK